jgi:hypothetical protein
MGMGSEGRGTIVPLAIAADIVGLVNKVHVTEPLGLVVVTPISVPPGPL